MGGGGGYKGMQGVYEGNAYGRGYWGSGAYLLVKSNGVTGEGGMGMHTGRGVHGYLAREGE